MTQFSTVPWTTDRFQTARNKGQETIPDGSYNNAAQQQFAFD
jgi:hypothetical protein